MHSSNNKKVKFFPQLSLSLSLLPLLLFTRHAVIAISLLPLFPFRISSKAKNDVRFLFVHPVAHAPRFPNTNNNKRNVRQELVAVHHASCGWHSSSAFLFFRTRQLVLCKVIIILSLPTSLVPLLKKYCFASQINTKYLFVRECRHHHHHHRRCRHRIPCHALSLLVHRRGRLLPPTGFYGIKCTTRATIYY